MLAVAQSPEGLAAQTRWDATLRGYAPNPGWTPRLGDIGRQLAITAVAAGRMLELLGFRFNKCVTDSAMAAGFGVPRWNGFTMENDWHLDRVVAAIRCAAQDTGNMAVGDALAVAVEKREGRERAGARKLKQEDEVAARRQEGQAVMSGLEVDIRMLRATDPGMSLLDAVEYTTCDPDRRIALYGRCSEEDQSANGMAQDDPGLLKIASSAAKDLDQSERRALAEGFRL